MKYYLMIVKEWLKTAISLFEVHPYHEPVPQKKNVYGDASIHWYRNQARVTLRETALERLSITHENCKTVMVYVRDIDKQSTHLTIQVHDGSTMLPFDATVLKVHASRKRDSKSFKYTLYLNGKDWLLKHPIRTHYIVNESASSSAKKPGTLVLKPYSRDGVLL